MTVRPAREDEIPRLTEFLKLSGHERVDLSRSVVFVAEEDGEIQGFLPARLVWQLEPLVVLPKNKSKRRRVAFQLPRAMENWLSNRLLNKTGIYSYFFVTRSQAWAKLAEHFGCKRLYQHCITLGRDT